MTRPRSQTHDDPEATVTRLEYSGRYMVKAMRGELLRGVAYRPLRTERDIFFKRWAVLTTPWDGRTRRMYAFRSSAIRAMVAAIQESASADEWLKAGFDD